MSASAAGPSAPEGGTRPGGGADQAGAAAGPAGRGDEHLDPRVAEVLQSLRSGVRQRQAEAATIGGLPGGAGADGGLAASLLAVRSHEYVQEPVAFSHRARFGKLIVFARKAFFHLFLKWFHRPLLAQQNAFNQAAGQLLQELAEAVERLARETRLLAARLAELEARQVGAGSAGAGEGARNDAGDKSDESDVSNVGALGDAGGFGGVAGGPGAAVRRDSPP